MRKRSVLLCFFLAGNLSLFAQLPLRKQQYSPSFSWSLGYSVGDESLPEGYPYSPFALFGQYRFARLGPLNVYGESQFAKVSTSNQLEGDYEFGINAGLSFQTRLFLPGLSFSGSIGSGPYYITVRTRRQAHGFIFSDNFEAGLNYQAPRGNTAFQLRVRFRHISNAGLKNPNSGIDNLFVVAGLSTRLF